MFKTNLTSSETETAALKETIIKLEKEVAEAKSEIEVHSHMMEENEHKSIDEAARLNKAIEDLQKDKESQAAVISDLQKDKESQAAVISDLQKDKESQAAVISDLQKDKESQAAVISDLQKDKESQAVLIEDFKGIHSQNQSEIGDLKKKIEVEMKALTSEL